MENKKMGATSKKKYHNLKLGEIINIVTTLNISLDEFLEESSSKYIDEYKRLEREKDKNDV